MGIPTLLDNQINLGWFIRSHQMCIIQNHLSQHRSNRCDIQLHASISSRFVSFFCPFSCHFFLAPAVKDDASIVKPSYKALIGFPTGGTSVNEQNTRPISIVEKIVEE